MMVSVKRMLVAALAVALLGACGGDDDDEAKTSATTSSSTSTTVETTTTIALEAVNLTSSTTSSSSSSTSSSSTTSTTARPAASTTSTAIPVYGSGVRGTVTAGAGKPLVATVTAVANGSPVVSTGSDPDGRYALTLSPGAYTITASTGPPEAPPCASKDVTVAVNAVATVDLDCPPPA